MGRHSAGEPDETGVRPDGMGHPWHPASPGNQQPMPPCSRCEAAFAAHLDGRCPQTQATTDRVAAQQWAARMQGTGQPSASWALPPSGPALVPQLVGPRLPRRNWPRRHPWLIGAIVLAALLMGLGIIKVVVTGAALETNSTLAKQLAENAVGDCLENAWTGAGYSNMFDSYVGPGVVEFRTGTAAAPTGDYADDTLIDVHVYANGTVVGIPSGTAGGPPPPSADDDAALDHWGCAPGRPTGQPRQKRPAGLTQDGPLDVGCKMTGTRGYTSYGGVVTIWNPGSSPQSVSEFAIDWGSGGVRLSQDPVEVSAEIAPGTAYTETVSAPASATSCVFAGWNP